MESTRPERVEFVVPANRCHVGGGLRAAFAEAKATGLPVQHLHPDGTLTICWFDGQKRRKARRRNVTILR